MSATNRGTKRQKNDYYATPLRTVYSLLDVYKDIKNTDTILEPSAGNGNIIKALRDVGYKNNITAIEIDASKIESIYKSGANKVIQTNYLQINEEKKYDVIIGNPPYIIAKEFIEKSLRLLNNNGHLIFLLRTNFLESKKRFNFWQEHPVKSLYVLSKRPSFTGKGTDATSYSWFIWENSTEKRQTINVIQGKKITNINSSIRR